MNPRVKAALAALNDEVSALVVSSPPNIRYLLNRPDLFDPDFSGLLVVSFEDVVLLVDGRYTAQAEAAGLDCRVTGCPAGVWRALYDMIEEAGYARVGFEPGSVTVAQWLRIEESLKAEPAPVGGIVEKLRRVKDRSEIAEIAKAAAVADRIFLRIVEEIKPGLKERDLAADIGYWLQKAGASAPSFDTIVASGPNSAFPHARATDRRLRAGDLVMIDFGAVVGGYCSDMTRTVVLGRAAPAQKKLYSYVAEAQAAVINNLIAGTTGAQADALARDFFTGIGKEENFGHNLGHGLGLEIHELPTLGRKSSEKLEPGMVFTIEPGLYYPNFGGVRIEDTVVMCEHGLDVLTRSTKDLLEL